MDLSSDQGQARQSPRRSLDTRPSPDSLAVATTVTSTSSPMGHLVGHPSLVTRRREAGLRCPVRGAGQLSLSAES